MPFLKQFSNTGSIIGLWWLNETSEQLWTDDLLNPAEKKLYSGFVNERRKYEFLATRNLLNHLLDGDFLLEYEDAGRPILIRPESHISISHAMGMAAVIVSRTPTGIDVEPISRNVEKAASRFLSDSEKIWTENTCNPNFYKLLCWCAKEAIFKMKRMANVDFSKHINILPIVNIEKQTLKAIFTIENLIEEIQFHYFTEKNHIIVWCVQ